MRQLAALAIGTAVVIITAKMGMHAAVFICLGIGVLVSLFWPWISWYLELKELDRYAKQYENIYEYSQDPYDREVFKRAEYHRKRLKESKNIVDPPVVVYELYFRDFDHLNESWEEFEQRVEDFIQKDREKRHDLKGLNKDREWYKKNKLRQIGVPWERKEG